MKKFIKNIAVFAAVVAAVTLLLNFIFIKFFMPDIDYTNKFSNMPDKLQVCNFGSSHGLYGYNYDDISSEYSCFNFSLTGQSLSYDYRLLQNYGDCIGDGTVVFLTLSYFSFFGEDETLDPVFAEKNRRNYAILPPELIKQYDLKTDIIVSYLPILGYDFSSLVKTLKGDNLSDDIDFFWTRNAADINVQSDADMAVNRHITVKSDTENGKMIRNQEEIDALYSLIAEIRNKGAVPILIVPPFLSEYTETVKARAPWFYDDFYGVVNEICSDTGVQFYDYAFDERFINSYDRFINADHLSRSGAAAFVDILMQEVVNEGNYESDH